VLVKSPPPFPFSQAPPPTLHQPAANKSSAADPSPVGSVPLGLGFPILIFLLYTGLGAI